MKYFAPILIALLFIASPADAQQAQKHFPPLSLNETMVSKISKMAREVSLPKAQYQDGTRVGKETPEQMKSAILPTAFESRVVNHSVFWTTIHWCKLNMANMGPTLRDLTQSQDWDKKQMVFIPVLHGTTHALVREQLLDLGECTDEFREYIISKHKAELTPQEQ